jgi:Mg-chelatase subunit ChlD
LTSDQAALDAALAGISLAPFTCLACGIESANAELHSPRRQSDHVPVLILLTDGRSNPRPVEDALASATLAKAGGVVIFTIGVGEELEPDALAAIASQPDFFYRAPDAEDLGEIYRAIAVAIPCGPGSYWGGR